MIIRELDKYYKQQLSSSLSINLSALNNSTLRLKKNLVNQSQIKNKYNSIGEEDVTDIMSNST